MKTATSLEIFINRFAFNKDAEIQYLYHGLTSGKPYIEQLANKVSLISESKSKEILQAIDELHFTTNNKQKIAKDCKELLEYISSSNNFDIIIAYVDNKIKNCLDNYECNKYLINHNKDCSLSNDISDWNSIVLEKNKIVDIQLKTN